MQRAINREPVDEHDWPYDDEASFRMIPAPGGCIMLSTPAHTAGDMPALHIVSPTEHSSTTVER